MPTIQVRDLPDDVYDMIRRRARESGQSLQAYMRHQLIAQARLELRKEAMFADMRSVMAADTGTGVTAEATLAALDEVRS